MNNRAIEKRLDTMSEQLSGMAAQMHDIEDMLKARPAVRRKPAAKKPAGDTRKFIDGDDTEQGLEVTAE